MQTIIHFNTHRGFQYQKSPAKTYRHQAAVQFSPRFGGPYERAGIAFGLAAITAAGIYVVTYSHIKWQRMPLSPISWRNTLPL